MGERLVNRGSLFANFDTAFICRRALPYRHHCGGSLRRRGAVGRTLDLRPARHHKPLTCTASKGLAVEAFLFLWLFELGNGFRSSYWILGNLLQAARKIWH